MRRNVKKRRRGKEGPTVEGGVHAANVDQEAHHGHTLGGFTVTEQLVTQHLACLAAPGHGVDVEVREALLAQAVLLVAVGEDLLLIVEDGAQEVVLDVLAPQRLAILFLEMPDLADGVSVGAVVPATLLTARLALGGLWGGHDTRVVVLGDAGHE